MSAPEDNHKVDQDDPRKPLSSATSTSSMFPLTLTNSKSKISFNGFQKKEVGRCLVCGGKECPKCGVNAYKKLEKPAIKFLHSHWITDYIVGMQRPSTASFELGALEDMKQKKITAVFNLTQPGEHPFCGPGIIHETGFPYNPEDLMKVGIKHFNFYWQDMTVPSIQQMMDIVNIAVHEINNGGKIAVHCHAGFGRTGLTIACIMIAKEQLTTANVAPYIRKRRPGSIQTSAQEEFINRFEKAYHLMMQIFPHYDLSLHSSNVSGNSSSNPSNFSPPIAKALSPPHQRQDGEGSHTSDASVTIDRRFDGVVSPREPIRRKSISNSSAPPLTISTAVEHHHQATSSPNKPHQAPLRKSFTTGNVGIISGDSATTTPRQPPSPSRRRAHSDAIEETHVQSPPSEQHPHSHHGPRRSLVNRQSFQLFSKSISQTTKDQQYLLTSQEYSNVSFKYIHKLVYMITQAYSLLAKDNFTIACLGLTGLTKLAIKNTMSSLIDIDDTAAQRSDKLIGISVGPLVKRRSSFMVATNALSESSEEGMLRDMKLELNGNKWTKLLSLGDIISASLRFSSDSVSKISKFSRGQSSSYSRSRLGGIGRSSSSVKDSSNNNYPAISVIRRDHSDEMKKGSSSSNMVLLRRGDSKNNKNDNEQERFPPSDSPPTLPRDAGNENASQPSSTTTVPDDQDSHAESKLPQGEEQQQQQEEHKPLISFPTNPQHRKSFVAASKRNINFRANSLKQTSDADYLKSKKMAANLVAQLLLDFIESRKDCIFNEEIIESLSKIWKENADINMSESDYHKEERSDAMKLNLLYEPITPRSLNERRASKLIVEIMDLLFQKLDRYKIELMNAIINMCVALHDVVKSSDSYQHQYSELMQAFSKVPGYQTAVQSAASHLKDHNHVAHHYTAATFSSNLHAQHGENHSEHQATPSHHLPPHHHPHHPPLDHQSSHSQHHPHHGGISRSHTNSSSLSTSSAGGDYLLSGTSGVINHEVLECMEALDSLVSLRFAIAFSHARKINHSLIKNRSLPVDLVKLFLLKASKAEFVIINNITFNEENYAAIKNHFGEPLLITLDIIFRTLRLLIEYHWHELNNYRDEEIRKEQQQQQQEEEAHGKHMDDGIAALNHGEDTSDKLSQLKSTSGSNLNGHDKNNSNKSNKNNEDIVMWNLFDYDDYLAHHKVSWNESAIHSTPMTP